MMEAGLVSLFWPFCGFFAGCRPDLTIPKHLIDSVNAKFSTAVLHCLSACRPLIIANFRRNE